jgi:hypothetical protein
VSKDGGNDAVWRAIVAKLTEMGKQDLGVRVGVLQSKGGGETYDEGLTLVEIAAIHEFGSEAAGVPERSFIRATINQKRTEIIRLQTKLARQIIVGKMEPETALGILGTFVAAEIRRTIVEKRTEGPEDQANAPSTIAAKGSTTPLVDTGRLLNAVQWEVVARGGGGVL